MELKLGRYLLPAEVVHHKKGFDNHPSNLEVYSSNGEHLAETLKGKIPNWTPEGKRRILESVRRPRGPRKKASHAKSKKETAMFGIPVAEVNAFAKWFLCVYKSDPAIGARF